MMKKLLLNLLLLLTMAIGAVAQQSLPYSYGFEDNDLSIDGWTTVNESSENAGDFGITTAAKKTGDYGFRFSSYNSDDVSYNQYLISPELNAASGLVFQFNYAASSSWGTETFKVGYSTTDNDVSSFTFGEEISTSSSSWVLSEEYAFPVGTKYVAIFYYSEYQYRLYVDDLTFVNPPSCQKPTALAATLTPGNGTIATLSWTENGTATAWSLEYGTAADFTGATSVDVSVTPSIDLTNLTEGTTYYARVKAVCGVDEESEWSPTFSFEPTAKIVIGSGTGTNSYLPTYTYYNYSLTQQIYTAAELGNTPAAIFSVDFYCSGAVTRNLDIYIVATDKASFGGASDWITVTANDLVFSGNVTFAANGWKTIEFTNWFIYNGSSNIAIIVDDNTGSYETEPSFSTFDATSQAIRVYSDGTNYDPASPSSYSGTIMNVKNQIRLLMGEPPTCYTPNNLQVSNVAPNSASLSWAAGNGETSFQICVNNDEANLITATGTTFDISGLASSTEYSIKVRAYCDVDDQSDWSDAANFTTLAACPVPSDITTSNIAATTATISWGDFNDSYNVRYRVSSDQILLSEDFENGMPAGWSAVDEDGDGHNWMLATELMSVFTSGGHNGSSDAVTSQSYDFTDDALNPDNWLITPAIELPNGAESINFKFYAAAQDAAYPGEHYGVYISTTTTDTDEFTMLWEETMDADGGSHRDQGAWGEKNTDLTSYAGETVYLAIRNFDCSDMFYLLIDDISLVATMEANEWTEVNNLTEATLALSNLAPNTTYEYQVMGVCGSTETEWSEINTFKTTVSCPVPTDLAVSNIGMASANLTWVAGAGETAWQISVNDGDPIDVTTNPYTLEGLTAGIAYTVKVRANCGADDVSIWTTPISFTTAFCEIENQCQISYTLTDPGAYGYGWYGAQINVYDSETDRLLATWKLESGETSANGTLSVCNGRQITFEWVSGQYDAYVAAYAVYEANGDEIFSGSGTMSESVNYTVNCSSCRKPSNLQVSNITATTANLAWVLGEAEENWQICLNDNEDDLILWDAAGYTLTGLTPNTEYTVKVRAYCSAEEQSSWITAIFTTLPTCVVPTTLAATNVTAHTATITWEQGGSETAWQLMVNDNDTEIVDVEDTPTYEMTGLTAETQYSVKVRAYCDVDDQSDWVNVDFTTLVACPAPTALAATLTPGNGTIATLSWTENGTATAWTLEYGTAADFTGAVSENVTGTSSIDLTGLTAETTYYARVKTVCGGIDGESAWSSVINFTPTNAYSITLNEGTTTNNIVPVYGAWVDNYSRSQFIIPASDLTALQGARITKLTYYSSNQLVNWGAAEFDVRLAEVENTTIGSLATWDDMTLAYHGSLGISDNVMEITFSTPYTYRGGNLMIGTNETTSGSWVGANWYGVTVTGASMGGYGTSINQQNFLPKVTINYIPVPTTHTITVNAGDNGYVYYNDALVAEPIEVTEGATPAFEITPATNYQIADLTVDGNAIDLTPVQLGGYTYTFEPVMADHTLVVTFEPIPTYTITVNAGDNGYVYYNDALVAEPIVVTEGATPAFEITPATGYQIDVLTVGGNTIELTEQQLGGFTYTFEPVMADHTLVVTFEAIPPTTYTITATAGDNGTITPSGAVSVEESADQPFEITPNANYEIDVLTVDSNEITLTEEQREGFTYTLYNVVADHTINVTFRLATSVEINNAASMAVYPNPNNGMFSIDFSNIEGEATYQIIDVRGAVVETRDINVTNGETKMFNHTLNAGTYFVRIIAGDKVYVEQIVVE